MPFLFTSGGGTLNFALNINSNKQDVNLKTEAVNAGWDEIRPIRVIVTVAEGVTVSASDASTPAFRTGGFGGALRAMVITCNGLIAGAGGRGGNGQWGNGAIKTEGTGSRTGENGGTAFEAEDNCELTVSATGELRGGGGGGAGGPYYPGGVYPYLPGGVIGGAGGGGAGTVGGLKGYTWSPAPYGGVDAADGTAEAGGRWGRGYPYPGWGNIPDGYPGGQGGDPGEAGWNSRVTGQGGAYTGAAGVSISGYSNITAYVNNGTQTGGVTG